MLDPLKLNLYILKNILNMISKFFGKTLSFIMLVDIVELQTLYFFSHYYT